MTIQLIKLSLRLINVLMKSQSINCMINQVGSDFFHRVNLKRVRVLVCVRARACVCLCLLVCERERAAPTRSNGEEICAPEPRFPGAPDAARPAIVRIKID